MVRRWLALAVATIVAVLLVLPGIDHTVIGNVMATAIAVIALTFAGLYLTRSNWRATIAGRSLLYVMASFGLFATQVTVSAWTHSSYPGRDEVRAVLYTVLMLALSNMVWTLYRMQTGRQ